jgi:arylsulfatase
MRYAHLALAVVTLVFAGGLRPLLGAADPPNVVLIVTDDQGYGDVGRFADPPEPALAFLAAPKGHPRFDTPNLDRLAKQGVRLTDFHVSQPVCSASRASLLTGCYANRLGIHGALGPNARHGLHPDEATLAELCKSKGYATGAVGKWHLGTTRNSSRPGTGSIRTSGCRTRTTCGRSTRRRRRAPTRRSRCSTARRSSTRTSPRPTRRS